MKKQMNGKAIGMTIGAMAAAAAGAYYLYGSDKATAHRKKLKSWMLRAKAEVMDEIENLKELNEEAYAKAVEKVMSKYKQIKGMDPEELIALGKRMHGHWNDIKKDLEKTAKKELKKSTTKKK